MGAKLLLLVSRLSYFREVGALGAFPWLHYFRNFEIKNTGLIHCAYCPYLLGYYLYVCRRNLILSDLTMAYIRHCGIE